PRVDGMQVLRAARDLSPETAVIVVTAVASTETAVEAMKLGAYDYITKPFKLDEVDLIIKNGLERKRLRDENLYLRRQLETQHRFENIIGKSAKIVDVFDTIRKIADSPATAMISGESGTGKELVARAIHFNSQRRDKPFVSVNCGAIPEGLMESELFGHVKGSFTGAVANKIGLFAAAEGGTLFLDEITEIPPLLQVKLVRAIQMREIRRVGDTKAIKTDARLIAASNRDLAPAARAGGGHRARHRAGDRRDARARVAARVGAPRAPRPGAGGPGPARGGRRPRGDAGRSRAPLPADGARADAGRADQGGRVAADDVPPVPLQAAEAQSGAPVRCRRVMTFLDSPGYKSRQRPRLPHASRRPRLAAVVPMPAGS